MGYEKPEMTHENFSVIYGILKIRVFCSCITLLYCLPAKPCMGEKMLSINFIDEQLLKNQNLKKK